MKRYFDENPERCLSAMYIVSGIALSAIAVAFLIEEGASKMVFIQFGCAFIFYSAAVCPNFLLQNPFKRNGVK